MRTAFLLPIFLFIAGCSASRYVTPDVARLPDEAFVRPSDGLLERPDLQAVVDLQVLRKGDQLIPYLDHEDADIRARAAFALGSVQYEGAVPELLGRLADASPNVRADAAFAIGQTADSTAALTLLGALRQESDPRVQVELVEALGKTGDEQALLDLLTIELPESVENTRHLAIARFGLRDIHHAEAVAYLFSREPNHVLLDPASAYYFGRMRDTAPWADQAEDLRTGYHNLFGSDPTIMHLMLAFGRLGDENDFDALTSTLAADPDWRNRNNAARAIGMLGDRVPRFQNNLLNALDDESANVAMTAAGVLAGIEEPSPGLVQQVGEWISANDHLPNVAGALLPVLVQGGRVDDVFAWLGARNDPLARARGLAALGGASDGESLGLLFGMASDDDSRIAYAALEALKQRWDDTRETADAQRFYTTFADGVARRDLATAYASAPVLTDSLFLPFDPGDHLRSVYGEMVAPFDIEPMVEIIKAVGEIRDGQEIGFLMDVMMQSTHGVLREAAEKALNGRLDEGIDVDATGSAAPRTVLIDWDQLADYGPRPLLTLFTEHGPIVIEMDAQQAPQTVQKIIRSAIRGDYDGVPFHRVVPNFVIQGGDYFRRDGFGGPDVAIRSEFTRIRYRTGTAGIASSGKDTEGVQYFITHSMQPHLDGRYTAFGQVIQGQDVVDRIRQGDLVVRAVVVKDG